MKKWFRVATEGNTTDGRKISREWVDQMARTYNPALYGARIWLEHFRGIFADGPFRAYGDVEAVQAREVEDGKLALFALIDPTDDLIAFNKARQKVYSSIEVDPDFAGSGAAYLVGLGVTDSPASLGTEMLRFSAAAEVNPLAARKQRPDNLFAAGVPVDFTAGEPEAPAPDPAPAAPQAPEATGETDPAPPAAPPTDSTEGPEGTPPAEPHAADLSAAVELMRRALSDTTEALSRAATAADLAALRAEFEAFRAQLDAEPAPASFNRPPATGAPSTAKTDC